MNEIDVFSDSKFNHLRCKLFEEDLHILKNPLELPCGQISCSGCILKMIKDDGKNCLCGERHSELAVNNLAKKRDLSDEINEKAKEITEEIVSKLLAYADNLQGIKLRFSFVISHKCLYICLDSFEERDKVIDKVCAKVKAQIDARVEEIKQQLESLRVELMGNLEDIKKKVYDECDKLNAEVSKKSKEYDDFSQSVEEMLKNYEANKDLLKKKIYECQDKIEELKEMDENFHKILRKVTFEPSDWVPDASYIGTFECEEFNLSDDESNGEDH